MGRTAPLADPTALVGGALTGGYRIVRVLSAQGFGVVFEARGPSGRRVALKVLRPDVVTEDTLSRLTREASVTAKLDNAHVVPIVDAGHDLERDLAYLVMPLLDGTDVAALLAETGPLAPEVAVRIALQAAAGLSAGHAAGLVYRDVRPPRIFLEHLASGEILVRVFGFGLSKGCDTATSAPGKAARSTGPLREESGPRDRSADVRGDVFGLAATLYEMLCGVSPWAELDVTADTAELGPADTAADAPAPSLAQFPSIQDRAPWIEARLATALSLALHSDVDRRYPSIEAFAEALRAASGSEERITIDMLTPLDPELREAIAERAGAEIDPLVGRELGGRYAVRRLIGRGGMGAVYEAESPEGRRVAAKVIFKSAVGQDDHAVRRFIREARAVTAIQSPHVVKTFELGMDLTLATPFIVMELLHGVDLAKLLRMRGPLEPEPVVRVFIQAARGLAAAHAEGIVHRDIKPANLFLHAPFEGAAQRPSTSIAPPSTRRSPLASAPPSTRRGPLASAPPSTQRGSLAAGPPSVRRSSGSVRPPPSGRRPSGSIRPPSSSDRRIVVKVCDFGIAKRTGDGVSHELTRAGGVLGSPIYMSPEQAKMAKDVDHRSDIWSLSVSLYQALCGSCPWDPDASLTELLLAICTERVPPLSGAAPWVSPALAAVVHRGLQRDPAERWQSMEELIAALESHAEGSGAVTMEQLRGIDPERRAGATPISALRESRLSRSVDGEERSIGGSSFTAVNAPSGATRRRFVGAAVTVIALAAIGGGLALRASTGDERGASPAAPSEPALPVAAAPAPAPAPASFTAVVTLPKDATARVNGAARSVSDGRLDLTGNAGDTFEIEVTRGEATTKGTVFMLSDGTIRPDRIDLQPPAPASASVAASEPALRRDRKTRAPRGALPVADPATPSATGAPAAPSAPTAVVPVDRW
ncbi:protein kinase domain-containing protein [Sorangium sp. So ce693]|uniref:serine/threonine-protein kinase n=1 Tax=Sorangium sp. So ce693 TaxID=3133318 RepID=UPI003F61BC59